MFSCLRTNEHTNEAINMTNRNISWRRQCGCGWWWWWWWWCGDGVIRNISSHLIDIRHLGNVFVDIGELLAFCLSLHVDMNQLLLDVWHNVKVIVQLPSHRRDRLTTPIRNWLLYCITWIGPRITGKIQRCRYFIYFLRFRRLCIYSKISVSHKVRQF